VTLATKSKIKWALFWNYLQKTSGQLLKFVIGIALARLLDPEDFGLIAMIAIFTEFSNRVMGLGLSSAIIQKKEVDDTDCNTVFHTNLALAVLCYLSLFAAAPAIAEFYNQPALNLITRLMALNLILQAGFSIHSTLLAKSLDFKSSMRINFVASLAGGITSIYFAFSGFTVWALVFGNLVSNMLKVLQFWRHSAWKPQLSYSYTRLRTLLPFGGKVTLLGLIEVVFTNLHTVVIGKLFTSSTLGFYARANSLQKFVASGITEPLRGVIYPALSKAQNQPEAFRNTFIKTLELTVFLVFPAMMFVMIEAQPFITVLIGEKWLPATPFLQILCLIGAIIPVRHHCSIALKSIGLVGTIIKYQMVGRSASIIAILFTYRYGVEAMLKGEVLATGLLVSLFLAKTSSKLDYPIKNQLLCMAPYALASIVAGSITSAIMQRVSWGNITELIVAFLIASISYFLVILAFKTPLSLEVRKTVGKRLDRGSNLN
jgi:teichuronic acid exporter